MEAARTDCLSVDDCSTKLVALLGLAMVLVVVLAKCAIIPHLESTYANEATLALKVDALEARANGLAATLERTTALLRDVRAEAGLPAVITPEHDARSEDYVTEANAVSDADVDLLEVENYLLRRAPL